MADEDLTFLQLGWDAEEDDLFGEGRGRPDLPGLPGDEAEGNSIIFADVTPDMRVYREEIFGPVLSIMPFDTEDEAVEIANDTVYGLSGYISGDQEEAVAVARRIRTGNMHVNGAGPDFNAPFGGYKQSGNGREWGKFGLEEYLEVKAVAGYNAA